MHQSFVNYRNYRYGTLATLATVATIVAYMLDKPRVPPNGGTWLGYTLGTIAGLLVIFLSLFGVRKRSFRSRIGTAIGWLSAHVYLGIAALVIATLHSGMHFGANVHTATYVLMWVVTVSGCWGVYAYVRYPGLMTRQRGNLRRKELLLQIAELDQRSLGLAGLVPRVEALIGDSIRRTDLGNPHLWAQLSAHDRSYLMIGGCQAQLGQLLDQRMIAEVRHEVRGSRSRFATDHQVGAVTGAQLRPQVRVVQVGAANRIADQGLDPRHEAGESQ